MAIGGDQGGSIRVPASWTGIVGLKPSHGLVPCTGSIGSVYSTYILASCPVIHTVYSRNLANGNVNY